MGEMAEYMLNGDDCAGCGMPFMDDDACGFPRYCDGCQPAKATARIPSHKPNKGKRHTPCPGCGRFLAGAFALSQHRAAKGH